jgi:hypothetical protein
MKTLPAALSAAALLAFAAPASAQQAAAPGAGAAAAAGPADARVNQLIVYGNDACPPSTDEVITVCLKLDESERYRIPPNLRGDPNAPENQAWASRAVELQYVGRSGIGSCSPSGAGGATGCFNEIVRQARAERAGDPRANWDALIDKARQERLDRIDGDAAEVEAETNPPR